MNQSDNKDLPDSTLKSLAIVVPCYNEEQVLVHTSSTLQVLLRQLIEAKKIAQHSRIYFVDDGSRDDTWKLIEGECYKSSLCSGIKLSCNRGHQNALCAGLYTVLEDMVVSIDADMQDDPEAIKRMVDAHYAGAEVVFGVRSSRKKDTFFKRYTAETYYKLMRKMGVNLVFNHADYRLLSRKAVRALKEYTETNIFLRGIICQVGFPSKIVEYERNERFAGESKYPLRKMLSFAWDGITSFSTKPLRIITIIGIFSSLLSLLVMAWVVVVWFVSPRAVPGWASILVPLLFIGSVQLVSLGVVGEYLAKVYKEVKSRPRFHIEKVANQDEAN